MIWLLILAVWFALLALLVWQLAWGRYMPRRRRLPRSVARPRRA